MRRYYLIGGGVGAVALVAAGLLLAAVRPQDGRDAGGGERLRIALVAAREPVPEPGAVMAVGRIVDGFDQADLAPPEVPVAVLDAAYVEAPLDWPQPQEDHRPATDAGPLPVAVVTVTAPQPEAAPQARRTRRRPSFGFDEPLPDFAAEREARRARLEATAPPIDRHGLDPVARRDPEMFY